MQSTGRRNFLTGRRSSQTPWEAFCQRMRNVVAGTFFEFDMHEGTGRARLVPKNAADVHQARTLCAEYSVMLALDGVPHAARLDDQHVLWVEPGRDLGRFQRIEEGSTKWFVQPGCLIGELEAAGFTQFADQPCHITVAAWIADRSLCDWDTGQTHRSGLVHASLLLADGTAASLGPFGENNTKPLNGRRLQSLVSSLFQASNGSDAEQCRKQSRWPARYRLDALFPQADPVDATVNLSHLLLGHGGDLGWVEWVVMDEQLAQPEKERPYAERYSSRRADDAGLLVPAGDLDTQVKMLFDPSGLFPHPGQDT